jgi:hypothetical protein
MGSTWENHGKTTGDSCETLMGDVFKMIYKWGYDMMNGSWGYNECD